MTSRRQFIRTQTPRHTRRCRELNQAAANRARYVLNQGYGYRRHAMNHSNVCVPERLSAKIDKARSSVLIGMRGQHLRTLPAGRGSYEADACDVKELEGTPRQAACSGTAPTDRSPQPWMVQQYK